VTRAPKLLVESDPLESEPALRYDNSHRAPMLDAAREIIERIIAREGVFRVPKDTGCFTAEV